MLEPGQGQCQRSKVGKERGPWARSHGRKWGSLEDEPRGEGEGLEACSRMVQLGPEIVRAGAVTLVAVKAEANTDPLVLAWIVTAGVHCVGRKQKSGTPSLGPEAWSPVTALF